MEQVLDRLQKANFRANLRKCYFGESKIDCLGYEITRDGIQPQPKKFEPYIPSMFCYGRDIYCLTFDLAFRYLTF
jgi:hypothetical protein